MAATLSGLLKAYLEGQGWGVSTYRDKVPWDDTETNIGRFLPVITIDEGVTELPELTGDHQDLTVAEGITVHLWDGWRDAAGGNVENLTLPHQLRRALSSYPGGNYGTPPIRVHGLNVVGRVRLLEGDGVANVVHHAYTVTVRRDT